MGLRTDPETFAEGVALQRRAGVRSVDFDDDGSIARYELYPTVHDTIPAPPPVAIIRDPHPDLMRDSEPPSERIARELEALARQSGIR